MAITMNTSQSPDPRRVAVGRLNRQKRRGLTAEGREALRQAAYLTKPWLYKPGPKTPEGKARSARNSKVQQKNEKSVRELARELAGLSRLADEMAALRQWLQGEQR
jgi:hypothetical protein